MSFNFSSKLKSGFNRSKLLVTLFSILLFMTSCLDTGGRVEGTVMSGVDQTTSPPEPTVLSQAWTFANSSDYIYNNEFLSHSSGQLSLNTVNTRFTTASMIALGTHNDTEYLSGVIQPVLSPIRTLDASWTPNFDRLIGYWKMNETSLTVGQSGQVTDSSGFSRHGTLYVAGAASATGLLDYAAYFNGTYQNRIEMTNAAATVSSAPNLTISMWFNPTTDNIDWTDTLKLGSCRIEMSGSNRHLHVYNCGGISSGLTLCTNCISANSWNHVAASFSSSEYKIIINGAIVRTGSAVGAWTIGDSLSLSESFKGRIDEVALFNKAFSVGDMQTIYYRQRSKYAGHYNSKVIDMGSAAATWTSMSVSTTLPFGKEINSSATPELSSDYPGLVNSSNQTGLNSQLNQNIVGLWHLNESSGSTLADSANTPNAFTGVNSVTLARPGQFGNAIYLNGTNQYLRTSNTDARYSFADQTFTVSMWFKTGATSSLQYLAALEAVSRGWGINISNSGRIGAIIKNAANTSAADFISTESGFNNGQWRHLVARFTTNTTTQTGNMIEIFIDGKQKTGTAGYAAGTTYSSPSNSYRLSIGARNASATVSDFFQGQIDEVAIWGRSLSQMEILELYRRGANRIKYQVKSCIDINCNCKTLGTSGTTSDCDGDGFLNSSDDLDIHRSDWIGPDGTNATYYSELQNNTSVNSSGSPTGTPQPTALSVNWNNSFYTSSASPSANQYFQFRAYFESDDEGNACSSSPCLPSLTAFIVNPLDRYYGGAPTLVNRIGVNFSRIKSLSKTDSSNCTTYQISTDDGATWKWWDGTAWTSTTMGVVASNTISDFTESRLQQLNSGTMKIKAFMNSNSSLNQSCVLTEIQMSYTQ